VHIIWVRILLVFCWKLIVTNPVSAHLFDNWKNCYCSIRFGQFPSLSCFCFFNNKTNLHFLTMLRYFCYMYVFLFRLLISVLVFLNTFLRFFTSFFLAVVTAHSVQELSSSGTVGSLGSSRRPPKCYLVSNYVSINCLSPYIPVLSAPLEGITTQFQV